MVDYQRNERGMIYDLQREQRHRSLIASEIYLDFLKPDEARAVTICRSKNAAV